jgi:hypothetical protein
MSDKDLKETIDALKSVRKDIGSSRKKAIAFLVKAGIMTPDGELSENYRHGA